MLEMVPFTSFRMTLAPVPRIPRHYPVGPPGPTLDFRPVTSPSPSADLSKLRINRDAPPPGVRRALGRNLAIAALALILIVGAVFALLGGGGVPVQVVTVAAAGGAEAGGGGAG